jgi:serine/threonine-protein kinase
MFNLLSGRLVHEGRTTNEHLLSAMTNPAPPLASILPGVGAAVAHVVDRALAFDKAERWRDARQMQEAVRRAYHDRNHAPITTAPRLTVPETVPDRTLASAKGPLAARLPTTGRPVVGTLMRWATLIPWARPSRAAFAVAGAGAVVIAVTSIAIAVTGPKPVAVRPPETPVVATHPVPVVATPTPTASATPEVAVTDLPITVPSSEPVPKSAPTAKPTPAAPAVVAPHPTPATPAPKATCSPPFVIDPTGKKHWKPECL